MSHEVNLCASVLGSFKKAKPEIDIAIEELTDAGVAVLGPDKGSPVLERRGTLLLPYRTFAPLSSEVGMTPEEVEQQFVEKCVKRSDFVVVVNLDGYIGNMVSYEIDVATKTGIPVYIRYLDKQQSSNRVMPIREIVMREQNRKALKRLGLVYSDSKL